MGRSLTDRHLAVWQNFLRVHTIVSDALEEELRAERGLSLAFYGVLLNLSRSPEGRMRLQDLAGRLFHSRSGLTRLIDRMEAEGLVVREPCSSDRRGTFAVITEQGRRTFRRAAPEHVRGIQRHFIDPLDEPDVAALEAAFSRILAAHGEATASSQE